MHGCKECNICRAVVLIANNVPSSIKLVDRVFIDLIAKNILFIFTVSEVIILI